MCIVYVIPGQYSHHIILNLFVKHDCIVVDRAKSIAEGIFYKFRT